MIGIKCEHDMPSWARIAILIVSNFVLAICGAAASATHQGAPTDPAVVAPALTDAEKDAFIQLAMRSGGLPGLQTVVVKNGQIVWMQSYGYAVLDQPGPRRPMRNDSLMLSASIPKILVTVAVLQQIENTVPGCNSVAEGFI